MNFSLVDSSLWREKPHARFIGWSDLANLLENSAFRNLIMRVYVYIYMTDMWICVFFFFRRLDSNLLECDCDIKWLWTYLRTNAGRVHATAVCHGPANLRGRHLSQLTEADFNCGMMWHTHTQNIRFISEKVHYF